jgi:hypothetical protein
MAKTNMDLVNAKKANEAVDLVGNDDKVFLKVKECKTRRSACSASRTSSTSAWPLSGNRNTPQRLRTCCA